MEDTRMIGWVLIDADKFINDVNVANIKFGDGITLTNRLASIGTCLATLHDAKRNLKSKKRYEILVDYPEYDGYGVMRLLNFDAICKLFKLKKEKYIPKKKDAVKEINQQSFNQKARYAEAKEAFESKVLLQEVRNIKEILNKFKEWRYGVENSSACLTRIDGKFDTLIQDINTLGKVQAQSMEYLKTIAEGIEKLNEKWQ